MSNAAPDPRFVSLLRDAKRVLIFTGAGISTNSGIADYRGPQGGAAAPSAKRPERTSIQA